MNDRRLRNGITAIVILLSLYLRFKSGIIDKKIIKKIIKEFGKEELINALIMLIKLLEIMDSEEILRRIAMLNDMEIDMKIQIQKLNDLLYFDTGVEKAEVTLTKKEQKKLQKEIRKLMEIIDHQIEGEKLITTDDFVFRIKKSIIHSKNIREKYEKPLEEEAKKKLINLKK